MLGRLGVRCRAMHVTQHVRRVSLAARCLAAPAGGARPRARLPLRGGAGRALPPLCVFACSRGSTSGASMLRSGGGGRRGPMLVLLPWFGCSCSIRGHLRKSKTAANSSRGAAQLRRQRPRRGETVSLADSASVLLLFLLPICCRCPPDPQCRGSRSRHASRPLDILAAAAWCPADAMPARLRGRMMLATAAVYRRRCCSCVAK